MNSMEELEKLTVVQLKEQLKQRNLSTGGVKAVLIQRLLDTSSAVDDNILLEGAGEEEIDDDLQELPEEAILGISTNEKPLPPPTLASPKIKKPTTELPSVPELDIGAKFTDTSIDEADVLREKHTAIKSPTLSSKTEPVTGVLTTPEEKSAGILNEQERREARAKKFNLPPADEDKKRLRAQRFNSGSTGDESGGRPASNKLSTAGTEKDVELLKKRAERFGIPISATATVGDLSSDERKRLRAQKFSADGDGGVAVADGKVKLVSVDGETINKRRQRFGDLNDDIDSIKVIKTSDSDAKKKRAERFGTK